MAIPKVIHYCWFGENEKPYSVEKCIKSWRKVCPDYQIIEWNEKNLDISAFPQFVQDAYRAKKWAFVTDFVRLYIVYQYGGIYLDTDVELIKRLDALLSYVAYFGFEEGMYINTGLGFGAEKGLEILEELMESYRTISFPENDCEIKEVSCPKLNTRVFLQHGLIVNDQRQVLDGNILILPSVYLCPLEYSTRILKKTQETYSIHWFRGSWNTLEEKKKYRHSVRKERVIRGRVAFTDMLKARLGEKYYVFRDMWRYLCHRK